MTRLSIALLLLATPALAQQQQPTAVDMLGQQLGACAVAQAQLIERINKLTAELSELKAKLEPGKQPEPPAAGPHSMPK